jgi:hypothetical protein
LLVIFHREEEEEHVVRENGDNKGVNVKDAVGQREGADDVVMGGEALEGLVERFGEDVPQGDGPTNGDPQMHRVVLKGQVGDQNEGLRSRWDKWRVRGADKAALVLVDAKARDG